MEYQEKLIILPVQIKGEDSTLNVTAYEAVETGLCYHATVGDASYGWTITHLASKKALCKPIRTEHETKLVMERVVGITDWTQDEKELTRPEIGREFLKCQQIVEGELNMQLETAMKICMPDYLIEDCLNEMEDEYPILRNALLYAFKIIG